MVVAPPHEVTARPEPTKGRRPQPGRAAAAAISLVMLLFVAGCGGDDGGAFNGAGDDSRADTNEDTRDDTRDDASDDDDARDDGDSWTSFTDPVTDLTADLPGDPTSQKLDVPVGDGTTIDTRIHMVESGDSAIAFSVIDLPGDFFDLEASVEGAATNIDGDVIETEPVTVGGYDAIDAEIRMLNGQGVGFYRTVHLPDRQVAVQLQSIGRSSKRDDVRAAFDTLIASFNP